jgi:hypothetical protein
VISFAQALHREIIERYDDPCPACGLCDPEWRAGCIHRDWCPRIDGEAG